MPDPAIKTDQKPEYKGRYKVVIIEAGMSDNRNYYPPEVLKEAAPLFDGVSVLVKSDQEHLNGQGKDVRNIIGRITEPSFIEEYENSRLEGVLEIVDTNTEIAQKIREANEKGMNNLFGLSIDALATTSVAHIKGKIARITNKITKVNSVDLIVTPGAGGQIVNLIEARNTVMTALSAREITTQVLRSNLPQDTEDRLLEAYDASFGVTKTELREAIGKERDYLARHTGGGTIQGLGNDNQEIIFKGNNNRLTVIETQEDKQDKMLEAFFDPEDKSVRSIRECYLEITGDKDFSSLYGTRTRLTEALTSTSFPFLLGETINRQMINYYERTDDFSIWKDLVYTVPVNNFKTQERSRFGGYLDLPIVPENNQYPALGSPNDENATYKIQKRGGTETLTLEMIANDDVQAVRLIPRKLADTAKRTLCKFVLDFLKDNPVIYDTKALFHADHNNLGTVALAGPAFTAARLSMKAQLEKNSNEKMNVRPSFLWVPDGLEEVAYDLFVRDTNNDPDFVQSVKPKIRPVWYWDDANDWCLSADQHLLPSIELGFFGPEEPQIFIQDQETSGSVFTHDRTTYKIRHIYGGAVVDYRGLYKSVVI